MNNTLQLVSINNESAKQVEEWLSKDHIVKWFHNPDEWMNEIKNRNGEFSFLHHFVVYNECEPIGFCQFYDCFDAKELWYSVEKRGELFSIDYLIGEKHNLHKGYGTLIVKLLINEIRNSCKNAEIIVQPDEDNVASIKVLIANGFMYDDFKKYFTITV